MRTTTNSETRQQTRQQPFPVTKHSKAYWLPRVFRPMIRGKEAPYYCVRMSCGGVQRKLSTSVPCRDQAAQIARDWFAFLARERSWAAFDAKYRNPSPGNKLFSTGGEHHDTGDALTVGGYLNAVRTESDLSH